MESEVHALEAGLVLIPSSSPETDVRVYILPQLSGSNHGHECILLGMTSVVLDPSPQWGGVSEIDWQGGAHRGTGVYTHDHIWKQRMKAGTTMRATLSRANAWIPVTK